MSTAATKERPGKGAGEKQEPKKSKKAGPPPAVEPVAGESKLVDIAEIKVMPQARTDFGDMEGLAQTIRESGILQPLLVRPNPSGFYAGQQEGFPHMFYVYNRAGHVISAPFYTKERAGKDTPAQAKAKAEAEAKRLNGGAYLLVAGERRLKGAVLAGLKQVPVIVRDLDDNQARSAQAIENLQRKDLKPTEEALLFQQLSESEGLDSIEKIANRIGKDADYVANRWPLIDLIPEGRELADSKKLPLMHARYIARIAAEIQPQVIAMAFQNTMGKPDLERSLSFPIFQQNVERTIFRSLSSAPWPVKWEVTPPPKGCATSCAVCKFNTANSKEQGLFGDPKTDAGTCTNAEGFKNRQATWLTVRSEEVKKETGKEPPFVTSQYFHGRTQDKKHYGPVERVLGRDEYFLIPARATRCAAAEAAFVVGTGAVGDVAAGGAVTICREPSCKDHAGAAGSSLSTRAASSSPGQQPKPKSAAEVQQARDRKQELFDLKVNEPVRGKALVEAVKAVTWKKITREHFNVMALAHYCRVRTHTQKVVQAVYKLATGVELPDGRLDDNGRPSSQKLIELVGKMPQDDLARFMLLCSQAQLGENEYMNHRKSQASVRAFVEAWGVNYAMLDAEERLMQSPRKYNQRHLEHAEKVRAGKADVKDAPKVYDVDEDPRPKSEAASAGKSSGTNSSAAGGRGRSSSKASSSPTSSATKGRTAAATTSKSTSPNAASAPSARRTAAKSSKAGRSGASSTKAARASKK
ncbi:MAG TPA: ParB/RepB/Spo0J family partition protein [Pyrinomonadaceae bacterium]|jgi:ParB/RepB/Spo0J family partition protein